MAPRIGKAKAHKPKGDKRKAEKVVVPLDFDIGVILPDESQVVLKGISTDRILDVRRLLSVHAETCHLTNYSLHHEVRGARIPDGYEVASLKPPIFTLVEEDYNQDQAVAHVRRLLDIISCTTHFGDSAKRKEIRTVERSKLAESSEQVVSEGTRFGVEKEDEEIIPFDSTADQRRRGGLLFTSAKRDTHEHDQDNSVLVSSAAVQDEEQAHQVTSVVPVTAVAAAREATERGDIFGLCPPSDLGRFYEFFSLSHLTRPIQSLCRSTKLETQGQEFYFGVEVRLCNGKLLIVAACAKGFQSCSKQFLQRRTLVALLKSSSQAFSKAYDELLEGFLERNKFGNIPYGLRSNTWVVPPVAANAPWDFPPTPAEDETWGGNGGGQGHCGAGKDRPWAEQFAIIAKMACETVEQRLIRDKKAFLLHNLFVDVAVTASAEVVKQWDEERSSAEQVYQQEVRNLIVRVSRDVDDASKKAETKIEGSHLSGKTPVELAERNLLKGITANQNTTVHDIYTLGAVVVRHRGYIAVVEASGLNTVQSEGLPDDFEIEAQPEGGVNALNVNSLRTLLHTSSDLGAGGVNRVKVGSGGAHAIVEKVIEDSLVGLMSELTQSSPFIRLELGACWLQHLQTEVGTQESEGKPPYEVDHQQVRKVQSTSDDSVRDEEHPAGCDVSIAGNVDHHSDISMSQLRRDDPKSQQTLRIKLGEAAYKRLQESGTGLHLQSVPELMDGVTKYHNEIVISKLVADFASLELAPIDGRTLSDFMHSRGLRMRSLGRVAELSAKLPHMQSLCEHEMVARALKHVVRAVVAAIGGIQHLASRIAVVLNFAFGTVPTRGAELLWKWVEMFVKKRFSWELSVSCRRELRPHAVLRGLCHKIGIELAPRNYNFESTEPFDKLDVVSIVPIYKHVSCSSADARTLLESCKTALDKGKGEEAISYGTKALAKLIGVCGPYHRMTAGAYSLLAVVLYHTGDYNQAMIYQQKSLDINERELGLEHPDTIKSYGDVAVFYYRLQHTELAIKYVMRALYLLHLVCGPSHPNTAATYINVAMMEEGMGNVHVSLRYLHEALKCNVKLLGAEHTQTAATYHAMAIVLSMMDAYLLSVQHEQKTLQILEGKLGPEDPRTLDSAAWLQYFDSKAVEQQEAARSGTPRVDSSIASKGHLSVSDLVEFINSEGAGEAGGHSKAKSRRTKAKSRVTSVGTSLSGRAEGDVSAAESSSAVDTRTVAGGGVMADVVPIASVTEVTNQIVANGLPVSASETEVQPETPVVGTFDRFEDDGWQSAGHKGRSANGGGRRGLKGSISVTGMGSQGIRSIPGTMGEILGAGFEPRKTAANGTYTVDAERNRKTTAVISGRALSPLGNSGGHSSAEGPSTGGSALIVKPSLSTQGVGPDATEAGRKAEDAINSPSKASAMNGNSTGVPSSVDVSSPRLSRGSLSYKEAALAPAGLGTTSKGVACPGPDGAVDGKICKLVAADGRSNGTVQGMNLPQVKVVPSTDAGAKGSQGNLDMGCKLSNGVVNGKSNVKIAETKLAEKYDVTSEEDCGEKKKPEEKKAVFSGKRWADFDMEPTDNIESSNVVNRTAGYEGTDKLPMFNGNVQKAGRIIPPADRDVQKPGRRSYWKDVDVHGSARGGSKGREDNHRPADGQKSLGIPSKAGNGWSKNTYREVDHGTKTGQSSLENGHSASENGMSARKHDLKASQYGQRVFGNGHLVLENGEESSVVVHEVLESGQVEMNELGKNGFNHTNGHEAEKQTDGQLTTTRGNAGEKAVWNIKFGGVVESDMDIDPVGGSRSSTSSPKEIVECAVEIGSTNGAEVDQVEHRELSEATDNDNVNLLEAQSCVPSEQKISSCEQHLEDEVCDEAEQASDSMQLPPESNGTEDKSDLSQVETSHDAGKRLSASAPPFTPTVSPGSRVVAAVTPFKGGKAPFVPVSLPAVRPPAISSIHNTIAVTPIRKVGPTLASPVPSNQLQGVVVASNQPPPVFILPPATAAQGQLPASLATGPGEVKVLETDSLSGHARLTMNPNAKEFVPRTMNPNAAVFVPGRAWPSAGLQGAHRCTQCGMGTEQVGSVGLESYGNASWDDSVMTFGADGIPAEESGDSTNVSEEKEQFVAGIGGNHGFEKRLGSFEGNSELEGSSEEDGSSFTEKYDEPVLFGNTADVIGTWKQEIPCM